MQVAPVTAYTYCENCRQPVRVAANRVGRIAICPECHRLHELEKKRLRSSWSPGDYRMIYDPSDSWSPTGNTYLDRVAIEREIRHGNIDPGTRFECRERIYIVSTEYKLVRTQ